MELCSPYINHSSSQHHKHVKISFHASLVEHYSSSLNRLVNSIKKALETLQNQWFWEFLFILCFVEKCILPQLFGGGFGGTFQ
jgi:hypothetical protein